MFAPKDFTLPFHEFDVRPGGSYRVCMRSPEGHNYWLNGIYQEIAAPERLVFSHVWEEERAGRATLVTVTFGEEEGKTRLLFHQAPFESIEERDSHGEGWNECFDKLAEGLGRS